MSKWQQLAIGCAAVASYPQLFELSDTYRAMYMGVLTAPKGLEEVSVLRLVKTPANAKTAVSRGINPVEYSSGPWHYIRFVDKDKLEVIRCVMWHEQIAQASSDFSSTRSSAAIQYKPDIKSFERALRFNGISVLQRYEIGNWLVAAYVDRHPKTYRLMITGASPEAEAQAVAAEPCKTVQLNSDFNDLATHAFANIK